MWAFSLCPPRLGEHLNGWLPFRVILWLSQLLRRRRSLTSVRSSLIFCYSQDFSLLNYRVPTQTTNCGKRIEFRASPNLSAIISYVIVLALYLNSMLTPDSTGVGMTCKNTFHPRRKKHNSNNCMQGDNKHFIAELCYFVYGPLIAARQSYHAFQANQMMYVRPEISPLSNHHIFHRSQDILSFYRVPALSNLLGQETKYRIAPNLSAITPNVATLLLVRTWLPVPHFHMFRVDTWQHRYCANLRRMSF